MFVYVLELYMYNRRGFYILALSLPHLELARTSVGLNVRRRLHCIHHLCVFDIGLQPSI